MLIAAPVDADGVALSFSSPADVEGQRLVVDGAEWILVVFRESGGGLLNLNETRLHEQTTSGLVRVVHVDGGFQTGVRPRGSWDNASREVAGLPAFDASFGPWSSLYLEANDIRLSAATFSGQFDIKGADETLWKFRTPEDHEKDLYLEPFPLGSHAVTKFGHEEASGVTFSAEGIRFVQWYNASVTCASAACPSGGGPSITTLASASTYTVTSERFNYSSMAGDLTSAAFNGLADYVVTGGSQLSTQVDGRVRMASVNGDANCEACFSPQDQTLTLEGKLLISELRAHGNTLQAQVDGDFQAAALDETSIDPSLVTGTAAAAAATAGAAFLLKFLLAPFFTRLSKAEALEHPRRKAIFEHIQRNPGTSFRETARTVGIAAGTVRHHLNVLERAGMVIERPHGATVRFFELKDSDTDWVSVVMLREPALKLLHDWLKLHPGSPQTGVLEAMEEQGWSRSTTQHRLSRLVDSGLVTIRLQGRYKMYSVVDPQEAAKARSSPAAIVPATSSAAPQVWQDAQ